MSKITLIDTSLAKVREGVATPEEAIQEVLEQTSSLPDVMQTNRTYRPKTREQRKLEYASDKELRLRTIQSSMPFISPKFGPDFKMSQGLILVCARPGQSKSTTAANVVAGVLDADQNKKALVITNEETAEATYNRIACVQLRKRFIDLHRGKMHRADKELVEDHVGLLFDSVEVIAGNSEYDMTTLEDVKAVMNHAAQSDVGLVVLDYLQTVSFSRENEHWEPFQVSKNLGFFLKEFGRRARVPVVVFAQLKPNSEASEMQSRIQNDKTIYNHAFTVIEIVPDFETCVTSFVIHKDRFGSTKQGQEVQMKYKDGRYVSMDEDEL